MLGKLLAHPLTRGLAVDDPQTTALRRRIIAEKRFLRRLYAEWYARLRAKAPAEDVVPGKVLELGSGGGFCRELWPECLTSEVFPCPHVDVVFDGRAMPLVEQSLRAVIMVDVLHHIPDVQAFFAEAARVVRPGGVVTMIEPWNTTFARQIYQRLHPEPFEPEQGREMDEPAARWRFPSRGPLSGANGALPWILFERDARHFARANPAWRVEEIALDYPWSYLASGGVSMRSLSPGWSYGLWRGLETRLPTAWMRRLAMFAHITLVRGAT